MGRHVSESTSAWYARAVHVLQAALADEDAHWLRLVKGRPAEDDEHPPVLDRAYRDAVARVDRAQYELFEAAKARDMEQQLKPHR